MQIYYLSQIFKKKKNYKKEKKRKRVTFKIWSNIIQKAQIIILINSQSKMKQIKLKKRKI